MGAISDIHGPRLVPAKPDQELNVIRHIVFFAARDREDLPEIIEGLKPLGSIPHVDHFEVTENTKVDLNANDVDVVVYAEFADQAALGAYRAHPT